MSSWMTIDINTHEVIQMTDKTATTQTTSQQPPKVSKFPEELIDWVPEDGYKEDIEDNKESEDDVLDGIVGDQGC